MLRRGRAVDLLRNELEQAQKRERRVQKDGRQQKGFVETHGKYLRSLDWRRCPSDPRRHDHSKDENDKLKIKASNAHRIHKPAIPEPSLVCHRARALCRESGKTHPRRPQLFVKHNTPRPHPTHAPPRAPQNRNNPRPHVTCVKRNHPLSLPPLNPPLSPLSSPQPHRFVPNYRPFMPPAPTQLVSPASNLYSASCRTALLVPTTPVVSR